MNKIAAIKLVRLLKKTVHILCEDEKKQIKLMALDIIIKDKIFQMVYFERFTTMTQQNNFNFVNIVLFAIYYVLSSL